MCVKCLIITLLLNIMFLPLFSLIQMLNCEFLVITELCVCLVL
jgi:hypothetical protein